MKRCFSGHSLVDIAFIGLSTLRHALKTQSDLWRGELAPYQRAELRRCVAFH
jgi:hypothetical protein